VAVRENGHSFKCGAEIKMIGAKLSLSHGPALLCT
jgi:hypothetical protein